MAWYNNPFTHGKRYRVKKNVMGDYDRLQEGTILTYINSGHSSYDGYIGFFFTGKNGQSKRWDIHDHLDPGLEAENVFEEYVKKVEQEGRPSVKT